MREYWHRVLCIIGDADTPESRKKHSEILQELAVSTTTEQFEHLQGGGELSTLLMATLEQNQKALITEVIRGYGMYSLFVHPTQH